MKYDEKYDIEFEVNKILTKHNVSPLVYLKRDVDDICLFANNLPDLKRFEERGIREKLINNDLPDWITYSETEYSSDIIGISRLRIGRFYGDLIKEPLSKKEGLKMLKYVKENGDWPGQDHEDADEILLRIIHDEEITEAFCDIDKFYS